MSQMLMELEVEQQTGAALHERTPERKAQRNSYRERGWETWVGEVTLRIPKLRTGSYFPSLLEPRWRVEQALDEVVQAFRNQWLEARFLYVWLDALYLKVRQNHRILSQALVIAIGVSEQGERRLLGFALGASETEAFWQEFLRSLVGRGLQGVQLVISDAHEGLKAAIAQVLAGASWQRCRVHFMRNLLSHVPRGDQSIVAAALSTIFAQPSQEAAKVLRQAEHDIPADMAFPSEHWTRIYSTNVLERLNKEVRRRIDVVGSSRTTPR